MKKTYIQIKYRIRTTKQNYHLLYATAGANRYLWNQCLDYLQTTYKEKGKCDFSYFSLCRWYVQYKNEMKDPWLKDYPVAVTRTILKDLSIAYNAFVTGKRGYPRWKSKNRNRPSIPIEIQSNPFKMKGGNRRCYYFRIKKGHEIKLIHYHKQLKRYQNPIPKSARVTQSITGKWYLTVSYKVDAVERKEDRIGVGIDRNVGQVTDHHGTFYHLTDTSRIEKRIRKLQKQKAKKIKGSYRYKKIVKAIAKKHQKIKNIRNNDLKHIANQITRCSTSVVMEDLKTKGMTASASGTIEAPGKHVKAKSGLNRSILGTGWYQLEQHLSERGVVHKVNPAYTSQTCSCCGYVSKKNRLSQALFICQQCGYKDNAGNYISKWHSPWISL
ncbi:MAG: transposase [Flavobacteriaceae bacterium]|nr:transposase [Flavobacteriaceae bacterium]MCY4268254.1 transposase [Flavobacteriaceae bacterium]